MRFSDGLLALGVLTGIVIALLGLVEPGRTSLDDATAALVNQTPLSTDELQSLLQRRAQEGAPVDQLLRTLDDMIDEELLIQRADELGILRRDSVVRLAIVQAMEKSILSEERGRALPDGAIEEFYRDNTDLFAEPLRLQVEELLIADPALVPALFDRLREGDTAESLAAASASVSLTRLPPVPVTLDTLARRIPRDALDRLLAADPDDLLTYETSRGTHLLRLLRREEARVPPLEEIRVSVLNELQLQRQELAYEEYLAWLRQRAEIRVNPTLAH